MDKEERPELLLKKRDPSTHWFDSEHGRGCWASHVDCAIYKVEKLQAEKAAAEQYARNAEERMRIAEAKYDAEHADWLALDAKLAVADATIERVEERRDFFERNAHKATAMLVSEYDLRTAAEQRAERYEAVVGITYWALKVTASEGSETAIEAVAEADRIADRERVALAVSTAEGE